MAFTSGVNQPSGASGFTEIYRTLFPQPTFNSGQYVNSYPGGYVDTTGVGGEAGRFYDFLGNTVSTLMQSLGNFGGSGKAGAGAGAGDISSYLSQFDLPRQRAQQGLQDQFTQAGGVENLQGPFTTASQQLEQGLGQTEQGAQVDLFSRLLGPQSQILQVLLSSILGGLFGGR